MRPRPPGGRVGRAGRAVPTRSSRRRRADRGRRTGEPRGGRSIRSRNARSSARSRRCAERPTVRSRRRGRRSEHPPSRLETIRGQARDARGARRLGRAHRRLAERPRLPVARVGRVPRSARPARVAHRVRRRLPDARRRSGSAGRRRRLGLRDARPDPRRARRPHRDTRGGRRRAARGRRPRLVHRRRRDARRVRPRALPARRAGSSRSRRSRRRAIGWTSTSGRRTRTTATRQTIFGSFGATTRNNIRQAERHGLRVKRLDAGGGRAENEYESPGTLEGIEAGRARGRGGTERMLRGFYVMLDATAERRGFALASEDAFLDWSKRALAAGHMFYLQADHDVDGPVAGAVFYRHGHRLTYSLAGDRAELRKAHPGAVRLLVWRGIQIALDETPALGRPRGRRHGGRPRATGQGRPDLRDVPVQGVVRGALGRPDRRPPADDAPDAQPRGPADRATHVAPAVMRPSERSGWDPGFVGRVRPESSDARPISRRPPGPA